MAPVLNWASAITWRSVRRERECLWAYRHAAPRGLLGIDQTRALNIYAVDGRLVRILKLSASNFATTRVVRVKRCREHGAEVAAPNRLLEKRDRFHVVG